ncbi:MAG: hypothetical protein KA715_05750 [Xanthomonadaceae bacterium]|nr:hypothetical protein [Xanthomonadaceae bacterium]
MQSTHCSRFNQVNTAITSQYLRRRLACYHCRNVNACESKLVDQPTPQCDPKAMTDYGSVWNVGSQRWNSDWEKKFTAWLKTEVQPKFFVKFHITAECADAAFMLRAIFARIHHLPFVVHPGNKLREEGDKKFILKPLGHMTKDFSKLTTIPVWDETNWKTNIMKDKRFRAFLVELNAKFFTNDIPANTYPVKILSENRKGLSPYLRVGTVLFEGGHVNTVFKIDSLCRNPLILTSSSTTEEPLELHEDFSRGDFIKENNLGFVNWSWDVNCAGKWNKISDQKMPGYSKEQYSLKEESVREIYAKKNKSIITQAYLNKKIAIIIDAVKKRKGAVDKAISLQKDKMKELKDQKSVLYEIYSTPNRDEKICNQFNDLNLDIMDETSPISFASLFWKFESIKITTVNKTEITLADLMRSCSKGGGLGSSEPGDNLQLRWNLSDILSYREGSIYLKNEKRNIEINIRKVNSQIKYSISLLENNQWKTKSTITYDLKGNKLKEEKF